MGRDSPPGIREEATRHRAERAHGSNQSPRRVTRAEDEEVESSRSPLKQTDPTRPRPNGTPGRPVPRPSAHSPCDLQRSLHGGRCQS